MCRVCWCMVCWGVITIFDSIFVFIYLCIHVSNLLWLLYNIHLPLLFWLLYSFAVSTCQLVLVWLFFFYLFVLIAGSTCQLVLVAVSIELVLVAVNICLFYFFGCCIQICLVPHTHQIGKVSY